MDINTDLCLQFIFFDKRFAATRANKFATHTETGTETDFKNQQWAE